MTIVSLENGIKLESETAKAYIQLLTAARNDGIKAPSLTINAGYRTQEEQAKLYANRRPGIPVALPGYSKHEKGIAIDFNLDNLGLSKKDGTALTVDEVKAVMGKMRQTDAYKWLKLHAVEYGFVPLNFEPWHWDHSRQTENKSHDQSAIEKRAYALIKSSQSTPDDIYKCLIDLLNEKKPWYYGTVHKLEKAELWVAGADTRKDNFDLFGDQIDQYKKWIDGWRSGANSKSDYPLIQQTGKELLSSLLRFNFDSNESMIKSAITDKVTNAQDYAINKAYEAKEDAIQKTKEAATVVVGAVKDSASSIYQPLLILALGYMVISQTKSYALTRAFRGK